jgi:hypothetical protein
MAAAILALQPRRADSDGNLREFIFGIGQRGFSGWSRCKERLDERIAKELGAPLDHWTPHDLRRTMDTVMNGEGSAVSTTRRSICANGSMH